MGLKASDVDLLKKKVALCNADLGLKKVLSEIIDTLAETYAADESGNQVISLDSQTGLDETDLELATVTHLTFIDGLLTGKTLA